jgi:3-phenylpropionate/cinnamic acid dioxygenase small subunit
MSERSQLLEAGTEVLHQDGILLDEQRWDEWLELYAADCRFWIPMWQNESPLNGNTDNALSYIFYESRRGLEDRITRIRSRKSPASTPMPRTAHLLSNIALLESPQADRMRLRATWVCHVLFTRSRAQHAFFGRSEYALAATAAGWRIASKKVVLQNDDIPTMLDVYCV